jgi:hypothetical protein
MNEWLFGASVNNDACKTYLIAYLHRMHYGLWTFHFSVIAIFRTEGHLI